MPRMHTRQGHDVSTSKAKCPKCAHEFHVMYRAAEPPPPPEHDPNFDLTAALHDARTKLTTTTEDKP